MSEIKRYSGRPVEVEAMYLGQYGDFLRAVQWINGNGGYAVFAEASKANDHQDYLIIHNADGSFDVPVDSYVVKDVEGKFAGCRGSLFRATFAEVPADQYVEPLTGTGSYVRGAPDGATSLVGGAALTLP